MADNGGKRQEGGEKPPDKSQKGNKTPPAESQEGNKTPPAESQEGGKKSPAGEGTKKKPAEAFNPRAAATVPPRLPPRTETLASGREEEEPHEYRQNKGGKRYHYPDAIVWSTTPRQTDPAHRFFIISIDELIKRGLDPCVLHAVWDDPQPEAIGKAFAIRLLKRTIKGIVGFPLHTKKDEVHMQVCLFAVVEKGISAKRRLNMLDHLEKQFNALKKLAGEHGFNTDEEAYAIMVECWKYRMMFGWHWPRPFKPEMHHMIGDKVLTPGESGTEIDDKYEPKPWWHENSPRLRRPLTAAAAPGMPTKEGQATKEAEARLPLPFQKLRDQTKDEAAVLQQQQQQQQQQGAPAVVPDSPKEDAPAAQPKITREEMGTAMQAAQKSAAQSQAALDAMRQTVISQGISQGISGARAFVANEEEADTAAAAALEAETKKEGAQLQEDLETSGDEEEEEEDQQEGSATQRKLGAIKRVQSKQGRMTKAIKKDVTQIVSIVRTLTKDVRQLSWTATTRLTAGAKLPRELFTNDWEITKWMYEDEALYEKNYTLLLRAMVADTKANDLTYMNHALKQVCMPSYLALHYYPKKGNVEQNQYWLHPELFHALMQVGRDFVHQPSAEDAKSAKWNIEDACKTGSNALGAIRNK